MNSPPLVQLRRANLKALCSECRELQDRLNAATATLREIVSRQSETFAVLRDLDTVHDERNQIMKVFIGHLKTHTRSMAASTGM